MIAEIVVTGNTDEGHYVSVALPVEFLRQFKASNGQYLLGEPLASGWGHPAVARGIRGREKSCDAGETADGIIYQLTEDLLRARDSLVRKGNIFRVVFIDLTMPTSAKGEMK